MINNFFSLIPRLIDALMKWLYPPTPALNYIPDATVAHTEPPAPIEAVTSTPTPPVLLWDTPRHAYHSTRVLCDEMGLNVAQKNEICATIYAESEFKNGAVCINEDLNGKETSRDVGLCQWNSYWHTGVGKTFPSPEYVVAHPEEAVRKMIEFYKAGHINLWVAHSSGRYAQFLKPSSKMWDLKVV